MRKSKQRSKPNRRPLPRSGDPLADEIFRSFLKTLRQVKIYKKRGLRDPHDRRRKLYGLFDLDTIWLSPDKRPQEPIVKILIHELWHRFFLIGLAPEKEFKERLARKLEDALWAKLTDAQKKLLRSHIPKHYVKLQPRKKGA